MTLPNLAKGDVTDYGLILPEEMTMNEWVRTGKQLYKSFATLERGAISIMWWIGDFMNYGENRFTKEAYNQAESSFGFKYQTIANAKYVAKKIPPSLRKETITFSHYAALASLPPEAIKEVAKQILLDDLTVRETQTLVSQRKEKGCEWDIVLELHCTKSYRVRAKTEEEALIKTRRTTVRLKKSDVTVIKVVAR